MDNFKDDKRRRHFYRAQGVICKIYVSNNETRWYEVDLHDISASGAKFFCSSIKLENEFFVKINMLSGMSEFTFKTKAEVRRVEGENVYAVAFKDINKSTQVMIDEIINANNRGFDD